jgi:hypothetical protein
MWTTKLAFCLLATAATLLGPAREASARPDPQNFGWRVKHTIPACVDAAAMARQPNRIKYTFAGTGGSIKTATLVMAPAGTGIAAAMNMVTLTFTPKVPAGTMVEFTFNTSISPVTIASVEYFNDTLLPGNNVVTPQGNPPPPTIESTPVPTVSQWGLIALGLLLLIGGTLAMRAWAVRPTTRLQGA